MIEIFQAVETWPQAVAVLGASAALVVAFAMGLFVTVIVLRG